MFCIVGNVLCICDISFAFENLTSRWTAYDRRVVKGYCSICDAFE